MSTLYLTSITNKFCFSCDVQNETSMRTLCSVVLFTYTQTGLWCDENNQIQSTWPNLHPIIVRNDPECKVFCIHCTD